MPAESPAPREKRLSRTLPAAAAGLAVIVLAGAAFALTFDVLRDFAVAGRASERWAPAYPVMADALVVITVLSLIVARRARWWSRWLRGALLLLLVAGAAAISVQHALWGFGALPRDPVRAGVAVAPHVMLIIAVWLWLRMIAQLRRPRTAAPAVRRPAEAGAAESVAAAPAAGETVTVIPAGQGRPAPPPLALGPSDVEVARAARTTQPDMIMPAVPAPSGAPDDDAEDQAADRAEDPDAGDTLDTDPEGIDTSDDLPIWDWDKDPPSGSLRSSPTPPAD
ncbi:hypothetical protein [Spirillospora sp. NPDC029432]|uniref:hypothetical protein n=1 Tax=Spirillospora sp. NPDC029432 TaxID=3154599 RepID=UPI00345421EA